MLYSTSSGGNKIRISHQLPYSRRRFVSVYALKNTKTSVQPLSLKAVCTFTGRLSMDSSEGDTEVGHAAFHKLLRWCVSACDCPTHLVDLVLPPSFFPPPSPCPHPRPMRAPTPPPHFPSGPPYTDGRTPTHTR